MFLICNLQTKLYFYRTVNYQKDSELIDSSSGDFTYISGNLKWQDQGYFVIIVSSIIFVKLDCRMVTLIVN